MKRMFIATLGASALGLAACAHTVPVDSGATPAVSMSTASGGGRWSGRIASVTQNRGDVAQSTRDNSYGQADWTAGGRPTLSKVSLNFTYSGAERDLNWALISGSCGVAALPMLPMANFPEINIGGGGRGQVTTTLPLELPSAGSFHIDIYKTRTGGAENLVGCGNLKYSAH
ncbi:MAG: hypothetical protein ABIZ36_03050 [Gemmatimonadaceae bacterium]